MLQTCGWVQAGCSDQGAGLLCSIAGVHWPCPLLRWCHPFPCSRHAHLCNAQQTQSLKRLAVILGSNCYG